MIKFVTQTRIAVNTWMARELAAAIGYKDFRNFKGLIEKARILCAQNNAKVEDHFVETTEMVELGSGANRSVPSYRLTRYACLLIAMCANAKKSQALTALQYFSGKQEILKGVELYTDTDIVFFSDPEGNLRVQLFFVASQVESIRGIRQISGGSRPNVFV